MSDDRSTSLLTTTVDADETAPQSDNAKPGRWSRTWEGIVRLGLGEIALRVGAGLASIAMVLLVVWVMGNFYVKAQTPANTTPESGVVKAQALPTVTPTLVMPTYEPDLTSVFSGIFRLAQLHTIFPTRPRFDVSTYTVVSGDTIFGIAEKFNLRPETILWGNLYILGDDPHNLQPGQDLNIMPVNGVYHRWSAGEGLNGVAAYYGVSVNDIIDWPGNGLSTETVGDFSFPNIEPGTFLMVPNGRREFVSWSAPQIPRDNPAVASIFGPGACGPVDGATGSGPPFEWPAVNRFLSGYDYSPETNHRGIDVDGDMGHNIYAVDDGVVVYSGWNNWGYGNVVVIDHGGGWQSLYAHLMDGWFVGCGTSVARGAIIGYMGSTGNSTGPHLHFELRHAQLGKVNPWDYLKR
ncbi:MAG TPA: M23 family metallopeptidase [Anaerolineaceae bacterium]|nr:M23 family metallopeptidase [Anaerolineaceae bacterium]